MFYILYLFYYSFFIHTHIIQFRATHTSVLSKIVKIRKFVLVIHHQNGHFL